MKFSTITATALCASIASAAPTWGTWGKGGHKGPFEFTSTWSIVATPDQVVNGSNVPTGGLAVSSNLLFPILHTNKTLPLTLNFQGTTGYYNFGLNSKTNTICYNITLIGFRGDYQSPALTATHIHESARGLSGPPRIAFPNPVGDESYANSIGCLVGPFRTGLNTTGTTTDTGAGFNVGQIEEDPAAFNADVHSSLAVPGAVRGQFA